MRVIVDMASIVQTCFNAGKDREHGVEAKSLSGKPVWVNSATYGEQNTVAFMAGLLTTLEAVPTDLILVYEGKYGKQPRQAIDPNYKANRSDRCAEKDAQYGLCVSSVREGFRKLGAIGVTQDYVEGDDIIAYIAQNIEEDSIVVSNDGDLAVLEGINAYGAKIYTYIGGVMGKQVSCLPNKYLAVYKACVGDTSDNIKGVKGFGEKAMERFFAMFGEAGLDELKRCAEERSFETLVDSDTNIDKGVMKLLEGEKDFMRSYDLARLRPEWVNTFSNPWTLEPGMVMGRTGWEQFKQYEGKKRLVTLENFDTFKTWAEGQIKASPFVAFDIETSTEPDSDEWCAASGVKVDIIGSTLSGCSMTFGNNLQYTVYIPVDHADTANVPSAAVRDVVMGVGKPLVIHNTAFEGPVLYRAWGEDCKDNGYSGFVPDWRDTKLEASYVDENLPLGLKERSRIHLGYEQQTYEDVTVIDGVQHKMRELSGRHVLDYACDDTICTAALHNLFKFVCQIEHTYTAYKSVELSSAYLHAMAFVKGFRLDRPKLERLIREDNAIIEKASEVLNAYLISIGWEGTVAPKITEPVSKADVLAVASLLTGKTITTSARKYETLCDQIAKVCTGTAGLFRDKAFDILNAKAAEVFKPCPIFKVTSPKQMNELLYEKMKLPCEVHKKLTDKQREAGREQGNASTDALAMEYAVRHCKNKGLTAELEVLQAIKELRMCATRSSLFYEKYPEFVHWKTRRIHSSHNQCGTATRRASQSKPNIQQLSKHEKVEGYSPRVRELIIPHHRDALIVSLDFSAQELRVIADYTQDPGMLSCYVGDSLKDMHSITGVGIYNTWRKRLQDGCELTYEQFAAINKDPTDSRYKGPYGVKSARSLGKKTNFTTEYGAMAKKLAQTLLCSAEEAQLFIDAKLSAFPVVAQWKDQVIRETRRLGYTTTKLGARRHLREALCGDTWKALSAERQAVNFKIQGSSAEMTKMAEGRMWEAKLHERFDCQYIGPVHDEVVWSCAISDLKEFLPAVYSCMVVKYADMEVPIESSIAFGKSFGPAHQIELSDMAKHERAWFQELGGNVLHPDWIEHKIKEALAA